MHTARLRTTGGAANGDGGLYTLDPKRSGKAKPFPCPKAVPLLGEEPHSLATGMPEIQEPGGEPNA